MIVPAALVEQILDGRPTVVRFPVDLAEPYYRHRRPQIGGNRQSRQLVAPYVPGLGDRLRVRASGAGDESAPTIITARAIVAHETPPLVELQAAGYATVGEYQADWVRRYDKAWIAAETDLTNVARACWWPRTGGDDAGHRHASDWPRRALSLPALAGRFGAEWAGRPIWEATVELERRDRMRLLAQNPSYSGPYVSSPSQAMGGSMDPGEAIDARDQELVTARARMVEGQGDVLKAARRGRLTLSEQLDEVLADARAAGVDVRRQEASIHQRIEALRKTVNRAHAARGSRRVA